MPGKKTKPLNFEQSLKQLNTLVEKLEAGDLSLEASLQYFEQGISLTKACQQTLKEAEQKVQILIEKSGKTELDPYQEDD